MWRDNAGINRATGVIVPELQESIVAAVCRMVMIGKGGIRLHEEIFLAGARLKGGRALGEEISESILESALDGNNLHLLERKKLKDLATSWSTDSADTGLKSKVNAAILQRTAKRKEEIQGLLVRRQKEDLKRVNEIFERFEMVLTNSLAEAAREADEALQQLFDDEKQQRLDDIERWSVRLKSIRDERKREIEAVNLRYEDPQPFVFPAALVFALTPEDGAK
jgi:hypothetical protein